MPSYRMSPRHLVRRITTVSLTVLVASLLGVGAGLAIPHVEVTTGDCTSAVPGRNQDRTVPVTSSRIR